MLEEAQDPANPLLERIKFLSILGSNLAEFFMVRIAGLRQQIESGVAESGGDRLTPAETLRACHDEAYRLMSEARETFDAMLPELRAAGIHIHQLEELDAGPAAGRRRLLRRQGLPRAHAAGVRPGTAVPAHLQPESQSGRPVAGRRGRAALRPRQGASDAAALCARAHAGRRAGGPANDREAHFVYLEQLIAAHLDRLFPGLTLLGSYAFRVTRNAEMAIQELEADDLLETIEEGVRRRRFGHVVRCSIEERTPQFVRDILTKNLEIDPDEMVALKPPLGTSGLMELYGLDRPDLKDAVLRPRHAGRVRGRRADRRLRRHAPPRHPAAPSL